MSGTLNFQYHTFLGEAQNCIPASTIFQDEEASCHHDSIKLTKTILKCQQDIYDLLDSILASLQERTREEAKEDGNGVE